GCTGTGTTASPGLAGGTNDVSSCSGPTPIDFSKYKDPSASGTMCTKTSNAACQYVIALQTGLVGNPTTQNYEICTYLENGFNGGAAGMYRVSATSSAVVAGCI
ncbi:MAG TPA: hypothetical protein VN665_04285, partial [Candidatus Paceibacterota bacterium]|nr:hypothetical protein [Candidatus Paceibacterota bacterium]